MHQHDNETLWGAGGIGGFLGPVIGGRRRRVRAPEAAELREAQAIVSGRPPHTPFTIR